MSRAEKRALLKTLRHEPTNAAAFTSLGEMLVGGERVKLPDGRVLCERELYFEALRHNPAHAHAYLNLGLGAPPGERIKLPDGRAMGRRELYLEAPRGAAAQSCVCSRVRQSRSEHISRRAHQAARRPHDGCCRDQN